MSTVKLNKIQIMSADAFSNIANTNDDIIYCVQGAAVPSKRMESIPFIPSPESAHIYTAPSDGWVCLIFITNNTTWYIENTTTKLLKRGYQSTGYVSDYVRVAKGDVAAIYANLGSVHSCYFVYDK